MKHKKLVSILTIATAALLFVAPIANAGEEASGSSVSKQTKPAKAKHVYTDEDMPSTREGSKPADAAADNEAKPEEKMSAADAQKEYDKYDRAEMTLRKQLDELQKKADAAEDPFRKNMYQESIEHQQVTLQEFQDKKKKLQERISAEKEKESKHQS